MDPATAAATAAAAEAAKVGIDVAKVAFDSSIGCCTGPWFRISCVKGGGTAKCDKCEYHYCRFHFPVNNRGLQGGHVCK